MRNDRGPAAIPDTNDREQLSFALKNFTNQWGKQKTVSKCNAEYAIVKVIIGCYVALRKALNPSLGG